MDAFMAAVIAMSAVSLVLMLRNARVSGSIRFKPRIMGGEKGLTMVIDGKKYRGLVLVSENLPKRTPEIGRRVARLLRSSGVSVTFVTNLYNVGKDEVLRIIDEYIKRAEMAYQATRHVKYKNSLEFLKGLYSEVSMIHKPYAGSFSVILWIREDEEAKAEAFRSLLEAELGVRFKRLDSLSSLNEILEVDASLEPRVSVPLVTGEDVTPGPGVVIGHSIGDNSLYTIPWPGGFEKHMAVIGPTGRGKTVLLSGIAAQLSMMQRYRGDPRRVIIVDPKGDLRSLVWRVVDREERLKCLPIPESDSLLASRLVSGIKDRAGIPGVDDLEQCPVKLSLGAVLYDLTGLQEALRGAAASLILSAAIIEALEYEANPRTVIVIDEAWRISRGGRDAVEIAVREGRSKGLHLVYAIHEPSDMEKLILDNTGTIALFGGTTSSYVEAAAKLGFSGFEEDIAELTVGEALIRSGEEPPRAVRILDFRKLLKSV
ncbi:MAG: hypothetical protein F7B95_02385 [Desulfurococcales archaeon]|nr:hypothetical protein [Desulfurococcales archaeon]